MSHRFKRPFEGIVNMLERRYRQTSSDAVRRSIERLMVKSTCSACGGSRLRQEALCVKIAGEDIGSLSARDVASLAGWFEGELGLHGSVAKIALPLLAEIRSRLAFMKEVGVDYLTLDRAAATLSGGEAQRVRLASQLGSGLAGVLYVLDEPTIGLHPRDCRRLLGTLLHLRDRGNTVVVVEHDPDTIMSSDHVVEMGPGAGPIGGEVVASGSPKEIIENPRSLTGAWLSGRRRAEPPKKRRRKTGVLRLRGARGRNLKNIDVDI
ncbi:MAG: excinuclease ABC subunit A, partial [Deltaproteobacteria bacterium]